MSVVPPRTQSDMLVGAVRHAGGRMHMLWIGFPPAMDSKPRGKAHLHATESGTSADVLAGLYLKGC